MKKFILILAILSNTSFAVQLHTNAPVNTNVATTPAMEEYMKTKSGVISSIEDNSITIDNKSYTKAIDYRVYGKLVKKSYVKFNTNKSNQITDLWVTR